MRGGEHVGRRSLLLAPLPHLLPLLLLFTSLVLLRFELVGTLGMGPGQALGAGLLQGWYYDLVLSLGVAVGAWLLQGLLFVPWPLGWSLAASFLWVATLANVMHLRFFGIPLDWWIVELHWREVGVVKGSAVQLGLRPTILLSLALLIAALVQALLARRLGRRLGLPASPGLCSLQARGRSLLLALGLFLLAGFLWNAPDWFTTRLGRHATALGDNIVRVWALQNFGDYAGVGTGWAASLAGSLTEAEQAAPTRVLAAYQRLQPGRAPEIPPEPWPLQRRLAPAPESSRRTREQLGLPATGPINVLFLFVESMRAYEWQDATLSRLIFPRLHRVVDDRAISFTQTYSSSFSDGQTVRGQFSAQCSDLPNMTGAAEYIAHPTLRITCIQSFLKAHGYQTLWFNSWHSSFHGKRAFETLHGMDTYFDHDYFRTKGITQRIGDWGLADGPVLQETLAKLQELAAGGQPFYVNLLTISTHHPYTIVPEGPLPPELAALATTNEVYAAYLSRLIYEDGAVADFIQGIFDGPLGDSTLIVLQADHGSNVAPTGVDAVQQVELRFRIPLLFISKNLPRAAQIHEPAHQIDIVPTVAGILGLPGTVSWLGRDLFATEGSHWLYAAGDLLNYRVGERACYTLNNHPPVTCFDLAGKDPLFTPPTRQVPEDEELSRFFRKVAEANRRAIALNLFEPPPAPPAP